MAHRTGEPEPDFTYKGYSGVVTSIFSLDMVEPVYTYRGRVIGIRDVVTFVGEGGAAEINANTEREFQISVDDYLSWMTELGREPEKPTS